MFTADSVLAGVFVLWLTISTVFWLQRIPPEFGRMRWYHYPVSVFISLAVGWLYYLVRFVERVRR